MSAVGRIMPPMKTTCQHCNKRRASYIVRKPGEDDWAVCEHCAPAASEFAELVPMPTEGGES